MKKTLALLLSVMFCMMTNAVPALKVKKTITLPNGQVITVTLAGDEHYSYYVTDAGQVYAYDDTHTLKATTLDRVEEISSARRAVFNAQLPRRAATTGSHRGLVILAQFSDQKFTLSDPKTTFSEELNTVGYSQNSQSGSVHDYFLAQSNSQFDVTFDVVGPVTLDHAESYYGAPSGSAHDCNPYAMAYDAISKAKSAGYITSSNVGNYDWDSDGYVDMVYIVYAGYAQSNGADENTIWPHESQLVSTITVGSKKFSTYGCNSELTGTSGSTPTGIGTFVHEFSHCMGLRDAYDKSGAGNYCMGRFSVMAYGCYCGTNSGTPCNYTGFERWQSGWATPVELSEPTSITGMKSLSENGAFYIIKNPGKSDEFYMLENRQVDGWDKAIWSANTHGMLIYHIDHTSLFDQGPNYTATHPCYYVVPADASCTSLYKEYGMLFPQGSYYKNFPSTTAGIADRMTTYYVNTDGTYYMHKPLTNIAEVNGLIAFDFDGGSGGGGGDTPQTTATKIDRTGWTIKAYSELAEASGNEGPATYAIDNSTTTFYHSDWKGTTPTGKGVPQAFLIDMGSEHNISAWDYLGRNDDQPKGQPTSYRVYIYPDGTTSLPNFDGLGTYDQSKLSTSSLGTATKTGSWSWTSAKQVNKDSLSTPVKGRYLLLIADDVSTQSDGQKWLCCADFNIYEKSEGGGESTDADFTISAYTGTVTNHIWTSTYNKLYRVFLDNSASGIESISGDCLLMNTKAAGGSYSLTHDITISSNYEITSYSIYYKQSGTDEAGLESADGTHKVSINSSNPSGVFTVNDFTPASTVRFKGTNTVAEYKKFLIEKILLKIREKGSTPTGIDVEVPGQIESTSVYNLNGQRVSAPKKGQVYIMNGHKVLW